MEKPCSSWGDSCSYNLTMTGGYSRISLEELCTGLDREMDDHFLFCLGLALLTQVVEKSATLKNKRDLTNEILEMQERLQEITEGVCYEG